MIHFAILLIALGLPTCQTEDSSNCYWDASTQGNGQGSSFIDIKGEVYYLG